MDPGFRQDDDSNYVLEYQNNNFMIILKTPEQIEIMAEGGKRLARVLEYLAKEVRPGITTKFLDSMAYKHIREAGASPAFLNYRPAGAKKAYPFTLCASLNDTVVHGLPSDYVICEGDLVKLDLGLKYKGFYLDSAITVGVGSISKEAKKLIQATEESLARAIVSARPGKTLGDIGHAVETRVKKNNFSIVQSLTGHGIGRNLHEDPYVLNFGKAHDGERLLAGMVLALEPMVAIGKSDVLQRADESFVTRDGSLAAHFEHTVAITETGPRVLTRV
ncbi:MAG: type I methionyl aminopeptidase [Candidatus Liptonbacteria bacterium]|nr:type I methionyl aminopeptidase [Candidatus Liptonbacteria bacterium]